MLDKIILKLNRTLRKVINNQASEIKHLKQEQKKQIDDFVMTINELQDIQKIKEKSEEEKDQMRDSIINCKRTKYVIKLIELPNNRQAIK